MRKLVVALFCAVLFTSKPLYAGALPGSLEELEINRIVEIIGQGATMRVMKSSEPYELFPGIKFGIEIVALPSRGIGELGDGTGEIPGINMLPRLYIAKGLFYGMEVIASLFPASSENSISTTGIMLKYSFLYEEDSFASMSAFMGYTSIQGLEVYDGTNMELGLLISRDWVGIKPYVGMGILIAKGEINELLVLDPEFAKTTRPTLHPFFGIEFDYFLNITVQLDFMNLTPLVTTLFSKRF